MTTPTKTMPAACFHVLLSLADQPRHGLGVMEEVEERTGGAVALGPGSLYGSIKRLVADGWIRESEVRPDSASDDPRRRYYEVTPEGRTALESELLVLSRILDAARAKHLLAEEA